MSRDLVPDGERSPITDLRDAMTRIREVQLSGGLAVSMARYDIETDPINREFLADFLEALPVGYAYRSNMQGDTRPDKFTVEDPLNLRAVAAFGVFLTGEIGGYSDSTTPGFVIGERVVQEGSVSYTDLLIASATRRVGSDDKWQKASPAVYTARVVSERWNTLREHALNQLTTPYPTDLVMSSFSPGTAGCVIGASPNRFGIPRLEMVRWTTFERSVEGLGPRALRRALARMTELADNILGCTGVAPRTLRSSDFEEFDVMSHMEYIAAAFAAGKPFDDAKAKRDSAMPAHPAETTLGLSGYRQAIESGLTGRILPE